MWSSRGSSVSSLTRCAETDADSQKADQKRKNKNADLIVLNDVTRVGAGFGTETNIVTLISDDGIREYPLMSKREVADVILDEALRLRGKA